MEKRKIGDSSLEVTCISLGCWAFAGDQFWGDQSEKDSINTIHAALERGINFYDSAPAYGNGESERVLGKALQGRRDEAIIATKISDTELAPENLIASCERSLSLLQTDCIDLLQLHWVNRDVPFEDSIAAFEKLKADGKIRHYGVCNFGIGDMQEWLSKGGEMVSNQLPYNLLCRSIEYEVIPECEKSSVSLLPYSPLMQGLLTGKFTNAAEVPDGRARSRHFSNDRPLSRHGEEGCEEELFIAINKIKEIAQECGVSMGDLSLAWLLKQSNVASLIVGARNVDQLEQNLSGLQTEIDDATDQALRAATDKVKAHLGSNPDLWNAESRYR